MIKKTFICVVIFFIMFAVLGALIPFELVNADSTVSIIANPLTADSTADYKIILKITSINGLSAGQTIDVSFPSGYTIPSNILATSVTLTGSGTYGRTTNPSNITVIGNKITLTTSDGYSHYQIVTIEFSLSAGIKNPSMESSYTIEVSTQTQGKSGDTVYITSNGGSGTDVSNVTVIVSPAKAAKTARYNIIFNVSENGNLFASHNDYIDVYFPEGTGMPSQKDPSKVLIKQQNCTRVDISGTRVRVYLPDNLSIVNGDQCNISFLEEFGIKNPEVPGNYSLKVSTSEDSGVSTSNSFLIVGTGISKLTASVSPSSQSSVAEYKFVFYTSANGRLEKDSDKVGIVFPDSVTLPSNIIPGAITINDIPCTNVTIEEHKLILHVPVNISAEQEVTVIISKNFDIKNPDSTGTYTASVYTSNDATPVEVDFTITTSLISNVSVQLSTASAGVVCAYSISFNTGASGALSGGIDKINIIFPVGTTIITPIPESAVTVNNIPTTHVDVNGTTVTITVPTSIPANHTVSVLISETAGIKNPVMGANYTLYASTTKETSSVASAPYIIYNVPVTKATITPSTPDGQNGFYKTQPLVTFTATSAIDPNPNIYYYFGNNSPVLYNGQAIKVPEGVHVLYYYAVDNQNHKEPPLSMQIKVDTIPPQLIVSSPKDNAVLNSKDVTVSGTIDVGSTVKVNGQAANVDSAGHFTLVIHITNDSDVLNITAIDLAGNTSQQTLHVSIDTTPPALTVKTPVSFQEVHNLPLKVEGTTEAGAIVIINGNSATVDKDGNFSGSVPTLNENGISIITVIAKDAAGNSTKKVINVKYIKTTIITLQIGNKNSLVNGEAVALDSPPIIKEGRTLVPLRFVSEAFGATLSWDPIFQIINISLDSSTIRLQIGKKFAAVNGKKVMLDVSPVIVKGRTMVPIRFVSESLDAQVVWDGKTKTITIMYPKP